MSPVAAAAAPPLRLVRLADTRPTPEPASTRTLLPWPTPEARTGGRYRDLGLPEHVQGTLAVNLREEDPEPDCDPGVDLLPDPQVWAPRIVLHVAETAAGYRRVMHLSRYVSPEVLGRVARRHALATHRRVPAGPVRLRLVRTQRPAPAAVEVAAVVEQLRSTRVLAARLIGIRGRWVMTALEFG